MASFNRAKWQRAQGGIAVGRTWPGTDYTRGDPELPPPRPAFPPAERGPYGALPRQAPRDMEMESDPFLGGIEPGRHRSDRPSVTRRIHQMAAVLLPRPVISSSGGEGLLAQLDPAAGQGWRRVVFMDPTPRTWGHSFRRFYFLPSDPRSAPLVGKRMRVPSRAMNPKPRFGFSLADWRTTVNNPRVGG
jgi:hypothetical protein